MSLRWKRSSALSAAFSIATISASAATYSLVYSFGATSIDAQGPQAGLMLDNTGKLWGTTNGGGIHGYGAIFSINPATGVETVVYSDPYGQSDEYSTISGLMQDKKGYIWGTVETGPYARGRLNGAMFRLSPVKGKIGLWRNFGRFPGDGSDPQAGLMEDKNGSIWGTTASGGTNTTCVLTGIPGCGTVFKWARNGYFIVHSFGASSTDGVYPQSGLMQDANGNIWGTTPGGGTSPDSLCGNYGCGIVFEIAANGTYSIVHNFGANDTDGAGPVAGLMQDPNGNIWGTTEGGGAFGDGTVFEIAINGTYSVVHSFGGPANADGANPFGGLIQDKNENIWGTTNEGGVGNDCGAGNCGTVFEIAANGTYSVVYNFDPFPGGDGWGPSAGLALDASGNIWGTTSEGGKFGDGTVFEITP